ncbi:MAG: HAMP domain-containing sensor histidine kinase, partial [Oscillospiraceae bacterium]
SLELRTPMTSIGGFIDGMLDGTIEPENYGKYLRIVSDEVKRLSRMVISMLNISKIEAGEMKLNPSTIDISEIMCRTVLGFEYIINEKNINIEGLDSEKNYALADADMVSQICYNLIENAVKFTQESGVISVRYEHVGKMLKIAVRNSGDGIDKEEIPKLFDRFYKSDRSRSVNKKGVGLGLNIVKSLVNLHGGNITVKSVSGEYAEFEFTLPAADVKSSPNIFRKVKKEL